MTAVDTVRLTVAGDRRHVGVVNLVLGGIGSRLDLRYEQVDDLQLAVDAVLAASGLEEGREVTLEVDLVPDGPVLRIGPLHGDAARDAGVRRVLDSLVGDVRPLERDGGDWLELAPRARAGADA